MEFSSQETSSILKFYSDQKNRLLGELKHVDQMLRKLKGESQDKETGVLLTQTGSKARKRGPKSVWGKFILEQLNEKNQPLRYNDLIALAMAVKGSGAKEHSKVRASILNSAFRLRAIQGRIVTVGEDGKKDKFIVSRNWVDDDGCIRKSDLKYLSEEHGFTPKRVDVSEMPQARYAEDLV
jgi:hypothetical protein